MLIVPPSFQKVLKEWIKIPLPRCVVVSACRWCDEWEQVTYFGELMLLLIAKYCQQVLPRVQ
jgi:hypothetical protein